MQIKTYFEVALQQFTTLTRLSVVSSILSSECICLIMSNLRHSNVSNMSIYEATTHTYLANHCSVRTDLFKTKHTHTSHNL